MLSKNNKYKILLRVISILLIQALLVPNLAFALDKNTLSPPSRFWDDEATIRSIKSGEFYGKAFRNRVAPAVISSIIGDALYRNGVSPHTLISKIRRFLSQAEIDITKEQDPMLAGFELDELTYNEDKNEYYLPIYREIDGKRVKTLQYKFHTDESEKSALTRGISLGDGTYVYVDVEGVDEKTKLVAKLEQYIREHASKIRSSVDDVMETESIAEKSNDPEAVLALLQKYGDSSKTLLGLAILHITIHRYNAEGY